MRSFSRYSLEVLQWCREDSRRESAHSFAALSSRQTSQSPGPLPSMLISNPGPKGKQTRFLLRSRHPENPPPLSFSLEVKVLHFVAIGVNVLHSRLGLVAARVVNNRNRNSLEGRVPCQVRSKRGLAAFSYQLEQVVPHRASKRIEIRLCIAGALSLNHAVNCVLRVRGCAVGSEDLPITPRRQAPAVDSEIRKGKQPKNKNKGENGPPSRRGAHFLLVPV